MRRQRDWGVSNSSSGKPRSRCCVSQCCTPGNQCKSSAGQRVQTSLPPMPPGTSPRRVDEQIARHHPGAPPRPGGAAASKFAHRDHRRFTREKWDGITTGREGDSCEEANAPAVRALVPPHRAATATRGTGTLARRPTHADCVAEPAARRPRFTGVRAGIAVAPGTVLGIPLTQPPWVSRGLRTARVPRPQPSGPVHRRFRFLPQEFSGCEMTHR